MESTGKILIIFKEYFRQMDSANILDGNY